MDVGFTDSEAGLSDSDDDRIFDKNGIYVICPFGGGVSFLGLSSVKYSW